MKNPISSIISAIVYFGFIGYLNAFMALNLIDPLKNATSLPDIGHTYLPKIPHVIPNYLLLGYLAYFIFRFVKLRNIYHLSKFIWIINIIFTIRLFTFTVTILPPPLPHCESRMDNQSIVWNVLSHLYYDSDNTCIDMMFSGHASFFILIMIYSLILSNCNSEKLFSMAFCLVGLVSIIAGHIHYTTDVIIGIVITVLTSICMYPGRYYNPYV